MGEAGQRPKRRGAGGCASSTGRKRMHMKRPRWFEAMRCVHTQRRTWPLRRRSCRQAGHDMTGGAHGRVRMSGGLELAKLPAIDAEVGY